MRSGTNFFSCIHPLGRLRQNGRKILNTFTEKEGCRSLEWIQLWKENGDIIIGITKYMHKSSLNETSQWVFIKPATEL
jgi:hypothetical protein